MSTKSQEGAMSESFEVIPAFDDALNARLNAGIEPSVRREKTVGELIEEARRVERETIIHRIQLAADEPGEDRVHCGLMDAIDIVKAIGETDEQQPVQAGETEEAEALGSE